MTFQTLVDLMREETDRLNRDICVTSAALKVHYNSPDAEGYDIKDDTNSLATFMLRTKENLDADLHKRFNAI